jgi:hypothetical protein
MHAAEYYRQEAEHARRLRDLTYEDELWEMLDELAHDYEREAADVERNVEAQEDASLERH